MNNSNDNYNLDIKVTQLNTKKNIPNKKYTRKVYTNDEIKEILDDYIEVSKNKYYLLKPGNTRVCYIRADDNSWCRGGYITVNPIEKKDGSEMYMQLRGNIRKSTTGNVTWMVAYSGIVKLWVFAGPEYEYAKAEIKKSERKQREELSVLVDKISVHLRNLKREIRELKKEVKELKHSNDDDKSVVSGQTAFTDFSQLKIYRDTDTE